MPTLYDQMGRLNATVRANTEVAMSLDRRFRRWSLFTVLSGMVAAAALTGALVSRQAVQVANDRANDRAYAACVQFNVQRADERRALKGSLPALAGGHPLTDDQLAILAAYSSAVDDGLPYRDCSPLGIATYFRNLPADPNH